MTLPDLPAGVYQHYKGPLYQVLGYGHDANDDNRLVVIYIGIQLQGSHTGPRLAVRTVESDLLDVDAFFDFVHPTDQGNERPAGSKCLDYNCPCKHRVRRFTYLGPGVTERQIQASETVLSNACTCGGVQHRDGGCMCGAQKGKP